MRDNGGVGEGGVDVVVNSLGRGGVVMGGVLWVVRARWGCIWVL